MVKFHFLLKKKRIHSEHISNVYFNSLVVEYLLLCFFITTNLAPNVYAKLAN